MPGQLFSVKSQILKRTWITYFIWEIQGCYKELCICFVLLSFQFVSSGVFGAQGYELHPQLRYFDCLFWTALL